MDEIRNLNQDTATILDNLYEITAKTLLIALHGVALYNSICLQQSTMEKQ